MDKGLVPEPKKELRRKNLCSVNNLDVRGSHRPSAKILESGDPVLALGSLFVMMRGNRPFYLLI